MDKRKKYYMVLDTETCPLTPSNDVSPSNMFVYDIGYAIVDRKGNVYETNSFIISDIFQAEAELMRSSYYANKIPQYVNDLHNGTREMVTFYSARKSIVESLARWNTNIVIAHNARFDYGSLTNTQRWLTKSKYRYFFPKFVEIWDTMKMAQDTICKQKMYRYFCESNGYMTANHQVKKTAEVLYRYINGQNDFIESHTALEDVLIEKEIFAKCMAQHKAMRKKLWND